MSVLRSTASCFRGVGAAAKFVNTGRTALRLHRTATAIEGGIGVVRLGQAGLAAANGDGQLAAGHFGEAALRLLGAGVSLRAAPASNVASEVAALRQIAANNQSAAGRLLNQKINLRGAVVAERDALRASLSGSQRGPVVSGVFDRQTGQTFFGLNTRNGLPDLHPVLADRVAARGLTNVHAEVVALNRALSARGASGPVDFSDFILFNSRFSRTGGIANPAVNPVRGNNIVRCPNCTSITDGVISLSSGLP